MSILTSRGMVAFISGFVVYCALQFDRRLPVILVHDARGAEEAEKHTSFQIKPPALPVVPDEKNDFKAVLSEMREYNNTAKPLFETLHKLLKVNEPEITKFIRSLNELLSDDNRKSVATTLKNLLGTSEDLGKSLKAFYLVLDTAERMMKSINERMVTTERLMLSAERTVKNLGVATKPLAENADVVMKNLAAATDQLSRTLTTINRNDGSFNRLLNDPSIFNNLNASAASLARTMVQVEIVMRDLQVFSDKVARRPELLGVSGLLRQSNGVKEMPGVGPCLPPSPLDVPSFLPPIPPTRN